MELHVFWFRLYFCISSESIVFKKALASSGCLLLALTPIMLMGSKLKMSSFPRSLYVISGCSSMMFISMGMPSRF